MNAADRIAALEFTLRQIVKKAEGENGLGTNIEDDWRDTLEEIRDAAVTVLNED